MPARKAERRVYVPQHKRPKPKTKTKPKPKPAEGDE